MARIRINHAATYARPSGLLEGGPVLTVGKEYEARLSSGGWARVTDDDGCPALLRPQHFEIVEEDQ